MNYINKLNVFENNMETIAMFNSNGTRYLARKGIDPMQAIMKICSETPKNEEAEATTKAILSNIMASGYMLNGVFYDSHFAGSSDIRKATFVAANRDIIPELGKWEMCGLQTKNMKLAVNKFMAYIGLLWSASKPWEDVFGTKINVRRVAVIKDAFVNVSDKVDLTDMTTINYGVDRKVEINAFDGPAMVRKELTHGEACTGRAPWWKFLGVPVDFDLLKRWGETFVDYWGNTIKIDDVDLILTESCFKTIKLYENFEQYQKAFEELGHEISVCVREHAPKLKGLPYQQGQTLSGTEDDATRFMMHAKKVVYKYHDPKEAAGLLRGYHKQAAKMYPAMMNEVFTQRTIQEMYTTKRNDMLGGRIPEMGYNAFLAPDPVAFAQHLFGKKITGFLKAGECYCKAAKNGFVDITRNPHFDNAHVVLNNVEHCPLAEGPTMYINIFDMTTIRLRADYDGDHVWYSQDEHLLDLVNRTYEEIKNIPIDWDAPKAEKVQITKSAIAGFITNLIHGSEIGLYADALTKMWNKKYDRSVCDWLTFAGNVLIDAAKHGNINVKKPDAVKDLNMVSLPLFAMYAKADADRPAESDYWLKQRVTKTGAVLPPRCAYSGSFLDMYSKKIKENIPEILTIEGVEDQLFDVTKLMIQPKRTMNEYVGLWKKGRFNRETNQYEDYGLFQDIAFRHSTEWNKLVGETSFFANRQEWEEETGRSARKEITEWVIKNNPQMTEEEADDGAYDTITRFVFTTKMTDGMDTVIKQAFWRIYGDKAVKTLKTNLNTSIPDFDGEEWDELFDIDED